MRTVEVTRTYVEVKQDEFQPARLDDEHLRVERVLGCAPTFYRYLYTEVGRANYWTDRLAWTNQQIQSHLAAPTVTLYLLTFRGCPAGYFELVNLMPPTQAEIEINYLGILPEFQGHGLGKHLLTVAVETCFARGAKRVQLDTCTLDHPAALRNYLQRGFKVYMTEKFFRQLPDTATEFAEAGRLAAG